jgi:hypothetical protein
VNRNVLYEEFLKVMNGLLGLSQREIQILSLLIKIDLSWKPRSVNDVKNVLSTDNRRLIMKETMIKKTNLSKYIAEFKTKGLLIKNNSNGYEVLPDILPHLENNRVEVIFKLELNEK